MNWDLEGLRTDIAAVQEASRDLAPFGIGVLVHAEGVSGFVHPQGYQFTTPWGQAATWDPSMSRRVGELAARQARSVGIHLFLSPVLDLARDIRWGRVHETYGEDAELATRMGIGFVRGVQGDDGDSGILATGKHFLAYSISSGGLNQAVTQLGRRELVDVHAEPFRRLIAEAGLAVVMNSYNEIDGVPAVANRWLFTDLLRGQLGFDGLVVSDYGAVAMLHSVYRVAATPAHAAGIAIHAGLDVELPSADMSGGLRPLIEDGTFREEDLDRAVTNVLRLKARLGLIPDIRPSRPIPAVPPIERHIPEDAARDVAAAAVTLLANDGVLPLTAGAVKTAIVGPGADELRLHFGAYSTLSEAEIATTIHLINTGRLPGMTTTPDVFPDLFQTRFPGVEPLFEEMARELHPGSLTLVEALLEHEPTAEYHAFGNLEHAEPLDLAAMREALRDVDVVIAVVGERTGWSGNNTAGEGRTAADPSLPGNQNELIEALRGLGKRVVTVVVSGRPLLLLPVHEASNAVVLAPLLGPVAAPVIADCLYGVTEPGGRTPSTFPRQLGQLPMYYSHPVGSGYEHPTLPRHGYIDLDDSSPLYPFGHGLTYSSFDVTLTETGVWGDAVHASGSVRNTGERAGTAVVQLYARDEEASIVRPVKQLVEFTRVTLEPGESREVSFTVPLARLAYTGLDDRRVLEPGEISVLLGLSSADIRSHATVTVPGWAAAPTCIQPAPLAGRAGDVGSAGQLLVSPLPR
ncbi:glycoside hydrolase family 3 N-terminal domain-containing protein [Tessaracoccus defluvii]|uniref:Glycoside hydrolase family 3 C-terminal domain-containing protein n=2 Tax=Tessaracoccus defluvii TaxID=1285901 RepID=A0A7H0H4I0_9ACTN|nr:glycoside hydrolase family 3 N-terminal domain-containing protein [Tessaracoccus defluvii]QNP55446.1 glycoside hydrolase family 3 C-terminal domain-containing protein [Tessaracoccus defluvii]